MDGAEVSIKFQLSAGIITAETNLSNVFVKVCKYAGTSEVLSECHQAHLQHTTVSPHSLLVMTKVDREYPASSDIKCTDKYVQHR